MTNLNITDEQARVIEHILKAKPQLVHDGATYGGESVYALSVSANGEALMVGFNRWDEQHITQTSQNERYQMVTNRVTLAGSGMEHMDALCAAWISFRCKYLLPTVPAEPTQTSDDELGDLDERPF